MKRCRTRPGASRLAVASLFGWPGFAAAQVGSMPAEWTIGISVAVLVPALAAVWAWRERSRLAGELLEARARSTCLEPLFDVWLWQTDAKHRLVSVRPPHGAPAGDWAVARTPVALWDQFQAGDPAAVRSMLSSGASLDDLEVQFARVDRDPLGGRLRGRAHADASGRFAGYHGTFRAEPGSNVAAVGGIGTGAAVATGTPVPAAVPAPLPESTLAEADHESFSFTVSHDLRAPIRVVEGFTKIVKEDYGPLLDRVGNDHLDRVLGAAARMNNMIDALLALSKLSSQPLARQPVNLSQLATYVIDDLRRQWPDRAVAVDIEPDMHTFGDPTLLRVVVENLLGNAWKYTGKAVDPRIAFRRRSAEAQVYTVEDNGAGFDMRFADRLFGVFQRLHSASDFPGTGIGLASVRRIVRRHGGEIWGEAEVDRGARFQFSLPQGNPNDPGR